MKVTTTVGCVVLNLLLSCAAVGQSSFAFRNLDTLHGINAPVFDAQGVPLAGTNYLAELWGGASSDSLAPTVLFDRGNRREIIPFVSGGYFSSSSASLSVLSVPPNGWAWLQVRAWDARIGATYEEVAMLGVGGYGESPLFYAQGGNPLDLLAPIPAPLVGLQSFNLRAVVPEPNVVWLLLLGLPVFFFRSRWNK